VCWSLTQRATQPFEDTADVPAMSTALIEAPPTESPSPRIQPDPAACYGIAIEVALAAALREAAPLLVTPRRADPDRARRVAGHYVEAITGFALGAIASHLLTGLRSWYGEDGVALMRGAMQGWPVRPRVEIEGDVIAQLHARFCLVAAEARVLVDAVPARPMTPVMLSLLVKEDAVQRRVTAALRTGWLVYGAAVTHRRYPPLDPFWQAWVHQLDGKPVLTRDEVTGAGYIALVR
jgi:hypothetical protein